MAESRKLFRDDDYQANYDNEAFSSPPAEGAWNASGLDLGYYQRTHLEDVINNFIVAYVGADKVLQRVPRHEVAFFAQRAVQEFSYDIFHADKNIELELNPVTLQVPVPQDFVSLVKITYTGFDGQEYPAYEAQGTRAKQAILQDQNYEWNYDQDGTILYAEVSEATKRWQNPSNEFAQRDIARNYFYGSEYDEEYNYYSFYSFQGRRYGTDPQYDNKNGEYIFDRQRGIIYFGSGFAGGTGVNRDTGLAEQGFLVNIRYISDGLDAAGDLTKVYVPKLAEDAIYASILYNLAVIRPSAAQAAGLYKKEASAKMRNAKIRLQGYKLEEMTQVMRGKSKWIKH